VKRTAGRRVSLDWVVEESADRPRAAIFTWLILVLVSTPGLLQLRVEASTESVLDRLSPEWDFYQRSLGWFGSDEDIVIALPAEEPYDRRTLGLVDRLSQALEQIPGVDRVDSVATLPAVRSTDAGGVDLSPLISAELLASAPPGSIRDRLLGSAFAKDLLVSEDGRTFAIRLRLEPPGADGYGSLLGQVRSLAAESGGWVSGVPIFREETSAWTESQIARFVPATLVIVALVLLGLFRSVRAVLIAICVSSVGTWIVIGSMGAVGVPLTLSTAILPSVLLAIGCAGSTHLLSETMGASDQRSFREKATAVARPIAMAGGVTAVAFLSGAVVPIEAIRFVAVFGALGAIVLSLANCSLGTALLAASGGGPPTSRQLKWLESYCKTHVVTLAGTRPLSLVAIWIALLGLGFAGMMMVRLETDVTQWFPRGGEIRDDYEQISARVAGISPINIVIEAPAGRSIAEPGVVKSIDDMGVALEKRPEVGKALSIATAVRQFSQALGIGERLPADSGALNELLLMAEAGEQVGELMTPDRSAASVALRLNDNGSEHLLRVGEIARDWWRKNGVAGFSATPTGIMYEFARAEREIAVGQIGGVGLDVATLALLYLVVFRSLLLMAIALLPSVGTISLTFGLFGFLGVPLDAGTVFVGTLAVGVTVDETIHLVSAMGERMGRGASVDRAMSASLTSIFPALCATTASLALGFGVLGLSSFSFVSRLGLLTAFSMGVSVIANVTLLPALLEIVGSRAIGAVKGLGA
jgi:predicted RND superfamily exporter protein